VEKDDRSASQPSRRDTERGGKKKKKDIVIFSEPLLPKGTKKRKKKGGGGSGFCLRKKEGKRGTLDHLSDLLDRDHMTVEEEGKKI